MANIQQAVTLHTQELFYGFAKDGQLKTGDNGLSPEDFIKRVEAAHPQRQGENVQENHRARIARAYGGLRDEAREWFDYFRLGFSAERRTRLQNNWDEFKRHFKDSYYPTTSYEFDLIKASEKLNQNKGERVSAFVRRCLLHANKAYENVDLNHAVIGAPGAITAWDATVIPPQGTAGADAITPAVRDWIGQLLVRRSREEKEQHSTFSLRHLAMRNIISGLRMARPVISRYIDVRRRRRQITEIG